MGWGAGKKLFDVISNVRKILAIELLCAAEGIEHRSPLAPGAGTGDALAVVRESVPPLVADRAPKKDIEALARHIADGVFA